jgi:hypothetical protein
LQLVTGDPALAALSFGGNEAAPPVVLTDRLTARFTFDPAQSLLQLRQGELAFGNTQLLVSGKAAAGREGWKVDLNGCGVAHSRRSGERCPGPAPALMSYIFAALTEGEAIHGFKTRLAP